ncbi:MAG: mechanosensitive ion channel family protein [Chloroflexaceae bacterium]|nr:mechanosensitive ion channel family protein [Chloroflexaceae bacterium]
MKSVEAIQISLQEQLYTIIAIIVIMGVMWLLRRQFARLLLWLLKRTLDESKQYIIEVIDKSVYTFINHTLLVLIVYTCTIFFVQNARLAIIVNDIALSIFLLTFFRITFDLTRSITASSYRFRNVAHRDVDQTLMQLVRLLVNGFIVILGVTAIAQTWDIDLTTLFAGLGLGGLAISFAAQDTIKDIIGFIMIVSDKPFVLEEYISTPSAEGTVEDIGLRSVKVRALDQSLVIVPNSTIANESVTNWSRLEKRRFNFVVALPFATTAGQIETFTSEVQKMLQGREHVVSDSVLTLFTEYDSSALNILIRCYVTLPDYADALAERMAVNLEINRIIDRLGLRLALPARALTFDHVQEMPLPGHHVLGSPLRAEATQSGSFDAMVGVAGDARERNSVQE